MADAEDLKSFVRKSVPVQVRSGPPMKSVDNELEIFFYGTLPLGALMGILFMYGLRGLGF